jgi:hypothetical protein
MVKNLPTVERSTKIRFGKNCTNDQAENTVVFNASDIELDADTPGSVYMTPVRIDPDMTSDNIMVLAYNRDTKELTDSNAIAREILNFNLLGATKNGNVTPYTVEFKSTDAIPAAATSIVTTGNVGISNLSPTDTLSVGSKFHVNVDSSNVLTVLGNTYIQDRLIVNGDAIFNGLVTAVHSNNAVISDAIIEIGKNNSVGDSMLDLGFIMTRPGSNVAMGYLESSNEFAIAYTQSSANSHTITPLTSEDINVHVYGQIFTESNVGIINTSPTHTLDVGSNLFVDEFGSNILVVTGNTSISADLTVDGDTLFVDSGTDRVGVNTLVPDAELHVVGNVYVSSNLTVDTDTLHVDVVSNRVGINQINPTKDLDVNGTIAATRRVDNSGYDRLLIGTDTGTTIHSSSNAHLISLGYRAGYDRQQSNSVAIGYQAGSVTQAESSIAIGERSGETGQGASSIAIGDKAAFQNQAAYSIAIGENAGGQDQAGNSIALGKDAGSQNQGQKSIAIGEGAGKFNQGEGAIAIGYYAGYPTSQAAGSVIINGGTDAGGFNNTTTQNALFINPVRNVNNSNILMYNAGSKEFTYGNTIENNVHISRNLTVDTDTLFVDSFTESVGINTAAPNANLHVVGNTYISSNLTVDLNTLHVDTNKHFVGIETNHPDATLHLMGNAYISEDLTVDTDTFHVDSTTNSVGIETKTPDANLHVVGNVYVSSNLTVDTDTLHVDVENKFIGLGTVTPDANLHVVGNAYVSSNLTVDTNTLHVDTEANHIGINTINPDAEIHVVGNAYVSSNLTVDTDTFHVDTVNKSIGLGIVTPDANLHVSGNAYVSSTDNSTSKTSGSVIIGGGLGVAGDIHATHANLEDVEADSVNITDTTTSTSVTTGALRVAGGISTQENLNVGGDVSVIDTTAGNAAGPEVNLFRDITGADANYLGQIKFKGKNDNNNEKNYAKITGKISDASNGTEDGLIEFATIKGGSQSIRARLTSTNLKLLNDAGIEVDGTADITNTTGSTSTTTGALKVAGGISTQENLNVGGITKVWDATDSTSVATGAVRIVGGLGVAKNIHAKHVNFEDATVDSLTVEDTTLSTSKTTGAAVIAGGLGVTDNVYASRFVGDGGLLSNIATNLQSITENGNTTSNIVQFTGTGTSFVTSGKVGVSNVGPGHTLSVGTDFYVDEGGANTVVVDGNVSVSSNISVGGDISITGLTTNKFPIVGANKFLEDSIITKNGGDIVISGGLQVTGNILKTGNVFVVNSNNLVIQDRIITLANNNTQTGLDVGIIMEYPGHNIAIAHHGDEVPERLSIGYTQNNHMDASVTPDSNTITLDVLGNLQVQNDFTVDSTTFHVDSVTNRVGVLTKAPAYTLDIHGNSNVAVARSKSSVVTDATATTNKTSGAVTVIGGIGVGGDIHASDVNFENATLDSVVIQNTTAATNKTSGALQVTGGTGISGALFGSTAEFDGITKITNSTASTSKTSGALQVTGGVGVSGDIHATHVNFEDAEVDSLTVTDTTASSSTTTGAAKIAGGLGVAGSVYAAQYYGDGSTLTGLVTTFGAVVANGNTTSNTVQFTNANTGIITSGKIGVKTATPTYDLQVTGNSYISSNVTVDTNTFHVDAVNNKVGVGTTEPDKTLHVQGDIKFTGTLFEDDAPFVTSPWVTTGTDIYYNVGNVGFGTNANVDANVHVNGNVYVTSNVTAGFNTDLASCFGRAAVGYAGESNHATFAHVDNNTSTNYALKQTATGVTHLNTKANQHIRLSVNNNEKVRVTGGGDLKVGSNILYVDTQNNARRVGLGTATPNSNLHVVGNAFVSSNLTVGNNVYVTGGLVTNTGGVTKKTYSLSRTVTTGITPSVDINFTSNIFYAKITAQLIDGDEDMSTMILEVSGGRKSGETPTKNIAVGTKNIFGDQTNTNPWSPTVTTTGNKITLTTSNALDAQDGYDIFIEYMSSNSDGSVVSIVESGTTIETFGY